MNYYLWALVAWFALVAGTQVLILIMLKDVLILLNVISKTHSDTLTVLEILLDNKERGKQ